MRKRRLLVIGYQLLVWLIVVAAGQAAGLNVSLSLGLGENARNDRWTYVRLYCVNEGEPVEGAVVVQGFSLNKTPLAESYETPVSLPRHSKKDFFVYLPCDATVAYSRVQLVARGRVLFEELVGTSNSGRRNEAVLERGP